MENGDGFTTYIDVAGSSNLSVLNNTIYLTLYYEPNSGSLDTDKNYIYKIYAFDYLGNKNFSSATVIYQKDIN